jgi:hypothetical protein
MPLAPAPLLPGTSPLPIPGRRPPDRRAQRLGALAALPTLLVALLAGQFILPHIVFIAPGLQAQASGGGDRSGAGVFQGFVFNWSRRQSGGGYITTASLDNMRSESHDFHMNSVIIPVIADMPLRSGSVVLWHSTDRGNLDTLLDADYIRAIQDARKAGLVPILELQLRQQDTDRTQGREDPTYAGSVWSGLQSDRSISTGTIGNLERGWFNNYTAFAVHFAQIAEQFHLPYFIIGDQLTNLTYDTSKTTQKADPHGIDIPKGESYTCAGRRECEWRHVISALRNPSFLSLGDHKPQTGASYTGKLIYAANWGGAPEGDATAPEFEQIAWWNAVDYIGVDAFFPLMQVQADATVDDLERAWQGQGDGRDRDVGNIYTRLEKVSDTAGRPVIFTAAGYASAPGAASAQGVSSSPDDPEQLNDMQALIFTFKDSSWWTGVFWSEDRPVASREKQPNWNLSTMWAGDKLATSKLAGKWLASFYHDAPMQCAC